MSRRICWVVLLGTLLGLTAACTNKKSVNPLAGVGSKQPDKVLFDKAMDAMRHNRFDVARLTLQTLINTYPDSEFIARAKLAVADSWYAEGDNFFLDANEHPIERLFLADADLGGKVRKARNRAKFVQEQINLIAAAGDEDVDSLGTDENRAL